MDELTEHDDTDFDDDGGTLMYNEGSASSFQDISSLEDYSPQFKKKL